MSSIPIVHYPPSGGAHRLRHARHGHNPVEFDSNVMEAISEATVIRDARSRAHAERVLPDHMSGYFTGGSFVTALLIWLVLAPPTKFPILLLAACIAAHVVAASIEFEIGPGVALPTTPVLFVSLFLLPPQLVPVVPLAGLIGASYLARFRDPARHERLLVIAGSAWHAMGPAAVFALVGPRAIGADTVVVCAVALGAQFVCDAASSWVRNCYGMGLPTAKLAAALRFTFLVDVSLAPVGVVAAIAMPGSALALVLLAGPIALLALLQRDREHQIDRAVILSDAFTQSADRARRDVLTGLRNRLAWEEAIAKHADKPAPVGVVLADVDGLKAANDALGHDAGDRLLVAVATAISNATPTEGGAVAARLGGDEFGILLPGELAGLTAAIAESLQQSLSGDTADGSLVSASVGYGVARNGARLPLASIVADRGVYYDKARKEVGRR